jgi:hypothetical protein
VCRPFVGNARYAAETAYGCTCQKNEYGTRSVPTTITTTPAACVKSRTLRNFFDFDRLQFAELREAADGDDLVERAVGTAEAMRVVEIE